MPAVSELTDRWTATTAEELRERGSLKWSAPPKGVIGAWVAEMDFGTAPAVLDAWAESARRMEFGYPPEAAPRAMAEATAAWYAEHYGWHLDPKQVAPLPDVIAGLQVALTEFTAPGTPVIVPTPAYMPFLSVPPSLGHAVIEVPLLRGADGGFRLDLPAIDAELAAGAGMVILANPANPTGTVYPRAELVALAEIVDRHGARVFSDEIHAPLTLFGNRHVPLASVSEAAARVAVTATSASKAWNLPGLKCAQIILTNAADRERWTTIGFMASHGTSTPGMRANAAAYRGGEAWLAEVTGYIEENFRVLQRELAAQLPLASVAPLMATYLTWIDLSNYRVKGDLGAFLERRARVRVNAGTVFGQVAAGHIRLNIATPQPILVEAVGRIARALVS